MHPLLRLGHWPESTACQVPETPSLVVKLRQTQPTPRWAGLPRPRASSPFSYWVGPRIGPNHSPESYFFSLFLFENPLTCINDIKSACFQKIWIKCPNSSKIKLCVLDLCLSAFWIFRFSICLFVTSIGATYRNYMFCWYTKRSRQLRSLTPTTLRSSRVTCQVPHQTQPHRIILVMPWI